VLLEAAGRLLVERPGWAWARPASPWWREGGVRGAPLGALEGGERVLVLVTMPEAFDEEQDPEGGGLGLLADVVPDEGQVVRRVVLRAVDVLPWRRRAGEPLPHDAPASERARVRARAWAERQDRPERHGRPAKEPEGEGLPPGSGAV
jgi:hypothetical protein